MIKSVSLQAKCFEGNRANTRFLKTEHLVIRLRDKDFASARANQIPPKYFVFPFIYECVTKKNKFFGLFIVAL